MVQVFQPEGKGRALGPAGRPFGDGSECLPMLNMLDDASRRQVGGKVYARENLAAYIDFLKESFERFGLPLQIYVDQASFFKSQDGRHLTRLASRLKFYGVTLVFANSPESKGKIERRHQTRSTISTAKPG